MQKINKGSEPPKFKRWKRRNPKLDYKRLPPDERREVRQSCLNEQKCLCAYCCDVIDINTSRNEHIKPRKRYPNLSLDYKNIVASCRSEDHCEIKKRNTDIPLTPLMSACETELEFKDAIVYGTTPRAIDTIDILCLNETKLTDKRRSYVNSLIILHEQINDGTLTITEKQKLLKDEFQSGAYAPILLKMVDNII